MKKTCLSIVIITLLAVSILPHGIIYANSEQTNIYSTGIVPVTDDNIEYYGRWVSSADNSTKTAYFEGGVELNFTGTYFGVNFVNTPDVIISIDNGEFVRYTDSSNIVVADSLADGTHTAVIYSNYQNSNPKISNFVISENAYTLPVKAKKTIEFIGDSISVSWFGTDYNNGLQDSYNLKTATTLGFAQNTVAYGGISIASGEGSYDTSGMPIRYFKVGECNSDMANETYTAGTYQPDYIVVELGTNGSNSTTTVETAYISFLEKLRATYPKSIIFAMTPFTNKNVDLIRSSIMTRKAAGDTRLTFIDASSWGSETTDGIHPTPDCHNKIAANLSAFINDYIKKNNYIIENNVMVSDTNYKYDIQVLDTDCAPVSIVAMYNGDSLVGIDVTSCTNDASCYTVNVNCSSKPTMAKAFLLDNINSVKPLMKTKDLPLQTKQTSPKNYIISSGKPVKQSTYNKDGVGYPGTLALDGDYMTYWCAEGPADPQAIRIDLENQYNINKMQFTIYTTATTLPYYKYQILASNDSTAWSDDSGWITIVDRTDNGVYVDENYTITEYLDSCNYRYFKLRITDSEGGWTAIRELQYFTFDNPSVQYTNVAVGKTATASSTSHSVDNPASKAVDGNTGTYWCSADKTWPVWFKVDLTSNTEVNQVQILPQSAGVSNKYVIQGSYDNSTWVTVADHSSTTATVNSENMYVDDLSGCNYRYYQIVYNDGSWPAIQEFKLLHANSVVDENSGLTNVAARKTAKQSTYNSSGTTAGKGYDGNSAIDNNLETYWCASSDADPQALRVDLGKSYDLSKIEFVVYAGKNYKYQILGSNDSTAWSNDTGWTTIVDRTAEGVNIGDDQTVTEILEDCTYRYVKLRVTESTSAWTSIREFRCWSEL